MKILVFLCNLHGTENNSCEEDKTFIVQFISSGENMMQNENSFVQSEFYTQRIIHRVLVSCSLRFNLFVLFCSFCFPEEWTTSDKGLNELSCMLSKDHKKLRFLIYHYGKYF